MSYIECPRCGQRALSIATRCPRCGHDFPPHSLQRPVSRQERQRLRPVLLVAGALVAVVVIVALVWQWGVSGAVTTPSVATPLPPVPSHQSQPRRPAADSAPRSGIQPPVGRVVLRYATTWVNVRGGRSVRAPVVRVLNPGEVVQVDSLRMGWYRVLAEGRALGYAARTHLDAIPPRAGP
jgi:ribosomal protein L37E